MIIDPEFKTLIPPLAPEELEQLEANILADGCRDPLVTWRGEASAADRCGSGRPRHHGLALENLQPITTMSEEITTTTVQRIQTLAAELETLGKTALGKAVEAGNLLRECKASLAHGEWLPWIGMHFAFTDRTARNWMRVSEAAADGILETVSDLNEAYRLMSKDHKPSVHVAQNSGENEWYTPPQFIESARLVMGSIDTDPASNPIANATVKATRFFTKDEDGLKQKWQGNVWVNPPYAQPLMSQFAEAISDKFETGEIEQAIILVNNATETQWFQRMASVASAVCFPKSRVKFLDPNGKPGAPLQGQAIIYMGENRRVFHDEFRKYGAIFA